MKTNTLTKLVTALVLIMLFACEKQEIPQPGEETQMTGPDINLESFNIDELPKLANEINESTKTSKIGWTSKNDGKGIILDESRILAVTDSVGNTTYSIRTYLPDTPYNVFYNTLVKKETNRDYGEPIVLRFEVREDYFPTYVSTDRRKAPFKGKIDVYTLESFGDAEISGKTGGGTPCGGGINVGGGANSSEGPLGTGTYDGHGMNTGTWTGGRIGGFGSFGGFGGGGGNNDKPTGYVEVGEGEFGDYGTDGEWKRTVITGKGNPCDITLLVPVNEEEKSADPSCESFNFYKVGSTGVQVAAVDGIWDVVTRWGRCPGIGVAASYQTYYFHLSSHLNQYLAAERAADALEGAFYDLQKWFERQPCNQMNTGVLARKMDDFIKENFKEIGGQATRNAPLGWNGKSEKYKEDWMGTDDCY